MSMRRTVPTNSNALRQALLQNNQGQNNQTPQQNRTNNNQGNAHTPGGFQGNNNNNNNNQGNAHTPGNNNNNNTFQGNAAVRHHPNFQRKPAVVANNVWYFANGKAFENMRHNNADFNLIRAHYIEKTEADFQNLCNETLRKVASHFRTATRDEMPKRGAAYVFDENGMCTLLPFELIHCVAWVDCNNPAVSWSLQQTLDKGGRKANQLLSVLAPHNTTMTFERKRQEWLQFLLDETVARERIEEEFAHGLVADVALRCAHAVFNSYIYYRHPTHYYYRVGFGNYVLRNKTPQQMQETRAVVAANARCVQEGMYIYGNPLDAKFFEFGIFKRLRDNEDKMADPERKNTGSLFIQEYAISQPNRKTLDLLAYTPNVGKTLEFVCLFQWQADMHIGLSAQHHTLLQQDREDLIPEGAYNLLTELAWYRNSYPPRWTPYLLPPDQHFKNRDWGNVTKYLSTHVPGWDLPSVALIESHPRLQEFLINVVDFPTVDNLGEILPLINLNIRAYVNCPGTPNYLAGLQRGLVALYNKFVNDAVEFYRSNPRHYSAGTTPSAVSIRLSQDSNNTASSGKLVAAKNFALSESDKKLSRNLLGDDGENPAIFVPDYGNNNSSSTSSAALYAPKSQNSSSTANLSASNNSLPAVHFTQNKNNDKSMMMVMNDSFCEEQRAADAERQLQQALLADAASQKKSKHDSVKYVNDDDDEDELLLFSLPVAPPLSSVVVQSKNKNKNNQITTTTNNQQPLQTTTTTSNGPQRRDREQEEEEEEEAEPEEPFNEAKNTKKDKNKKKARAASPSSDDEDDEYDFEDGFLVDDEAEEVEEFEESEDFEEEK